MSISIASLFLLSALSSGQVEKEVEAKFEYRSEEHCLLIISIAEEELRINKLLGNISDKAVVFECGKIKKVIKQ
uniref:Uncharacterized protein n=1 Tax=Rhizobium phage IG49 TaxID=3129228 RepID=A0AAU8HYI7_9CAUD